MNFKVIPMTSQQRNQKGRKEIKIFSHFFLPISLNFPHFPYSYVHIFFENIIKNIFNIKNSCISVCYVMHIGKYVNITYILKEDFFTSYYKSTRKKGKRQKNKTLNFKHILTCATHVLFNSFSQLNVIKE